MTRSRFAALTALVIASASFLLATAAPAGAVDASSTSFAAGSSQTVSYGTNWLMPIVVRGLDDGDSVDATSGSVNVLVKGIAGTYATGLPLNDNGVAYFSPPSSRLPLGAGTYQMTAIYVPSGSSYLAPSQTGTPATLTVTALALSASFELDPVTVGNGPGLQVVGTVVPPNANTATPTGSWQVTATDSTGQVAFAKTVALPANHSDPVHVTLTQKVKPGREYKISAVFAPETDIASGYTVTNGSPQTVTVESKSFGEVMSTPFAAPGWLLFAIGLGLVLLIVTAIILLVGRRTETPATPAQPFNAGPARF